MASTTATSSQPIALPSANQSHPSSNTSSDFSMDGVGSYNGSGSGPFNPASYTRHFMGSPISWRSGSFGMPMMGTTPGNPSSFSSRFPVGSPTHQLLSSWEAGKTPSSMDVDRSSIVNALNVFDREGELCRNYTCCGLNLTDLHALLEHFEEVHIVVVDPTNTSQPQAHIQVPFNPQVTDLPQQRQQMTNRQANPSVAARNASAAAQFQQHLHNLASSAMSQQPSSSSFQQSAQGPTPFDTDDMELELDLDNGTGPAPLHSAPPSSTASSANGYYHGQSSTRSSPSSGVPSPPDTPISTPLSAYPSPHAFVPSNLPNGNALLSPYISHPSSPLSATAASTRQSSPTGFGPNAHQGAVRPNLNLNIYGRSHLGLGSTAANANNVLAHPEEAFNAYARFASDYSSCLPGAQFNGASRDEWERVRGVNQQQPQGQQVLQHRLPHHGQRVDQNPHQQQDQQVAEGHHLQQQQQPAQNDQLPMSCLPPALLFASSASCTPAGTPGGSRSGSPTYHNGQQQQQPHQGSNNSPVSAQTIHTAPVSPSDTASAHGRPGGSSSAGPSSAHPNNSQPSGSSSTTSLRPAASLLLSKPFRCPKPNCNKSYKQANGLKYHMTHGSCNFAPPKDLEHVKDLLERKRREREAAGGVVPRASVPGSNEPGTIGGLPSTLDTQLLSSYYDLNLSSMNITESELREVEREAEKRLRPFACAVGDCQRRYKNMNGLRYHYQHSGDHGAVGLALLASGQHECLQNGSHGRKAHHHHHSSTSAHPSSSHNSHSAATSPLDENDPRKRSVLFKSHSVSVPVSRTASRTGTPVPLVANSANTSPKSGAAHIGGGARQSPTSPIHPMHNVQQVNGVGINTGIPTSNSSSLSQALGQHQPHSQPSSQSPSPIMNNAHAAGGQQQYTQAQQQQQMAAAAYQQYAAQMQRQYQAALQQQQQQVQQHQQEYAMFEGNTAYPGMDMQ